MSETETEFSRFHVTKPGVQIDASGLPASPRKLYEKLKGLGWTLAAQSSSVQVDAQRYTSTNEERGYSIGDVQYPAYDVENFWVRGYRDNKLFTGWWVRKGTSTGFQNAVLNGRIQNKMGLFEEWLGFVRADKPTTDTEEI